MQLPQSRIREGASQAPIFHQVLQMQRLDSDDAVLFGKPRGQFVQDIIARAADLVMESSHFAASLFAVFAPL